MNSNYKVTRQKAYANIAFVKYWGKRGRQIPLNPSISMLIPQCYTETEIQYEMSSQLAVESFIFSGQQNDSFQTRVENYFRSIADVFPLANKLKMKIKSFNNFPHSAGIASSASAFAALAKCLVEIEQNESDIYGNKNRASYLARLGSGSACRSLNQSQFSLWGQTESGMGHDEYAMDLDQSEFSFTSKLLDTIIVIDSGSKEVSSSMGHQLMNHHHFRDARMKQANENIARILNSIKDNNFKLFGEVIENEALSLHAMMMTSTPSFTLLRPQTLKVIELIKEYRHKEGVPLYFTLDAGPNLHLIYKESDKEIVNQFIREFISPIVKEVIWGESHV